MPRKPSIPSSVPQELPSSTCTVFASSGRGAIIGSPTLARRTSISQCRILAPTVIWIVC